MSDFANYKNGSTQQQILHLLLDRREGMTVDAMADYFQIGRTAVTQHLTALQQAGNVTVGSSQKTSGRPRKIYVITEEGINLFPKKYSWFSNLLLSTLQNELGPERLADYMRNLGKQLAQGQQGRVDGRRSPDRVNQIVQIMNETGFEAKVVPSQGDETTPRIECKNCVYHDLARDYPQVCQFDLGFLSTLMGQEIEHQECMVRGGRACRFRFEPKRVIGVGAKTVSTKKATSKAADNSAKAPKRKKITRRRTCSVR